MNKLLAATAAIALTASMAHAQDIEDLGYVLDEGGLQIIAMTAVLAGAFGDEGDVDQYVLQGAFNQADLDGSINIDAGEGSVNFRAASEAADAAATADANTSGAVADAVTGTLNSTANASAVLGSSLSTTVIGAYNSASAELDSTGDGEEVAAFNVAYNYGELNGSVNIMSGAEDSLARDYWHGHHDVTVGFEAGDLNISTTVIGAYNMGSSALTYTDLGLEEIN